MKLDKQGSYLGKYREIIVAVAFFLVFDLAVLVLNFYISFEISADALSINLAGRQRMLSQRMTKALLTAQSDLQHGLPDAAALKELNTTVELFDTTLTGFERGAMVTGGDGKPVMLAAATSAEARDSLEQAAPIWAHYKALLAPLLINKYAPEQLAAAVDYARGHNLELLKLMNQLTTALERTANSKADTLRKVQTIGILLAMLNFGFILMKFLRRLRDNDRKVEAAQRETTEILNTVKEGLFLLDADFRVGSQYSTSLEQILGHRVEAGSDFREVLRAMLAGPAFESACDYIALLLGDRVKESLVTGLNPLTSVEVAAPGPNGTTTRRYLTLQFNRALQDGKISHLLVTVFDVTAQIELEHALADARSKARSEVEAMLDLLNVDPAALNQFLVGAERTLLDINDRLRGVKARHDYRTTIAALFRQVHTLKGDAATLGLEMFEVLAQQFETQLAGLRDKGAVNGEDLLALPLPLDEFLQRIVQVRELTQRLAAYHDAFTGAADVGALAENLETLAQRIAQDQGKEIRLVTELDLMGSLPQATFRELKDIAVQLLRNAVVHGIEPAGERAVRAKPEAGTIYMALKSAGAGEYEFVLRDDGRGLTPQRIRSALVESGRCSPTQLEQLDDRQVLMKIFEPGFTTAQQAGRDAGHGVGLDVVKQKIQQLGARLKIASLPEAFTQFSIRFAA